MKTIEIKKLTPGQWIECKTGRIIALIGQILTLEKLYQIKEVYSHTVIIFDDKGNEKAFDESELNFYFRHPVLIEGKEYECVLRCNFRPFHKGEKYIYSDHTAQSYWFKNKSGGKHAFTASEVLTHFGIDVREENKIDFEKIEKRLDDALAKETPESLTKWLAERRATDTPKPEEKKLAGDPFLEPKQEYLDAAVKQLPSWTGTEPIRDFARGMQYQDEINQSRIKELEGEVNRYKDYCGSSMFMSDYQNVSQIRNHVKTLQQQLQDLKNQDEIT